ncbi:uncharacterized protein [Prorops nasuta]|uniref:uncharacterized protein n=1 Tax=Prorops nasuta TaxID=863751 RepID=UPI0034CF8033
MSEQERSSDGYRCIPLNNYIQRTAADCETMNDGYVQFGGTPQNVLASNWGGYAPCQIGRYIRNSVLQSSTVESTQNNSLMQSLYMENISNHEANTTDQIYYHQQSLGRGMSANEGSDLLKTMSIDGTNYINVSYSDGTASIPDNRPLPSYSPQTIVNREYGLFGEQSIPLSHETISQNMNGKQFIDNLVGNWVPNQSGTYSPFGGTPNLAAPTTLAPEVSDFDKMARNSAEMKEIKVGRVATVEVTPVKPSYSDILTKSPPAPPSPLITLPTKPKVKSTVKKVSVKNAKNKGKSPVLKRQNSSGSDDRNLPKTPISINESEKENCSLPRRWVSLDNLETQELGEFDGTEQSERKKAPGKPAKKLERSETLNNTKIPDSNSKTCPPKRSIQINNNLNTINGLSKAPQSEQIEKNHQALNKANKPERKNGKEKNSKRSHNEKMSQTKKGQRNHKNDNRDASIKDLCKHLYKYVYRWSKIGLKIFYWLLHLICDVVSMSANLIVQLGKCAWYHTILYLRYSRIYIAGAFSRFSIVNAFGRRVDGWFGSSKYAFWRETNGKREKKEKGHMWIRNGLKSNIALPSTGEEAMKRLLDCKGKDPYSILGVTPTCSDDDIKKYYKRQAFLVHPDKNNQPGADEAFKILVHAFDIIGETERRKAFDQTIQVEAAWNELNDLLSQLHRKMEQAANTIRCTNCGLRHKRVPTQRPCYAARFCAQCKIRHSAKEGDIWAESRLMGFLWYYYACMDGVVYDVTDWAACQASNLKHLRANTHSVQYRIVLGLRTPSQTPNNAKKRQQVDSPKSEADIEDFLNNLYDHGKPGDQSRTTSEANSFKSECRRRKAKRKK